MKLASETTSPGIPNESKLRGGIPAATVLSFMLSGVSEGLRGVMVGVNSVTASQAYQYSETSTAEDPRISEAESRFSRVLGEARDELFEDGMENALSRALAVLLQQYSSALVDVVTSSVIGAGVSPSVAAETLRTLGRLAHPTTEWDRFWLLARSLQSSSAVVRDAAALGLAHLGRPAAAEHIRHAIDREPIAELREDLRQVLVELECSPDAIPYQDR